MLKLFVALLFSLTLSPVAHAAEEFTFIQDDLVNNTVLTEYYSEYEKLTETATLSDLQDKENLDGSTMDEVLENFETSVEPEITDLDESASVIEWRYEGEEISQSTGEPSIGQLLTYFHNDHLIFIGFSTLDHAAELGQAMDRSIFDLWLVNPEISPEEMSKDIKKGGKGVLGVGQVKFYDEIIKSVLVFVNADQGEDTIIYAAPILYGERGFYHASLRTYEELLQSPNQLLLDDSLYLISLANEETTPAE